MFSSLWILILLTFLSVMQHIEQYEDERDFTQQYLKHSTKCFSCEKDMILRSGYNMAWMGQDTKSFDSEKDLIIRSGDVSKAFQAHDIRYY